MNMMMMMMMMICLLWFKVCLCYSIDLHPMLHSEYFILPLPFQELAKKTNIFFVCCSQVFRLKRIQEQWPSALSLKVSWMDIYSQFYDGWLRTACNWGPKIAWLHQQIYHKYSATTCIQGRRQKGVPSTI